MITYIEVQEDGCVSGHGSSPFSDKCIEIEIDENHPLLTSLPLSYRYVEGELIENTVHLLDEAIQDKDKELNEACRKSIMDGFEHEIDGEVYHFSYDIEAQINFGDARMALQSGLVESIGWTARKNGEYTRVRIDKELMDEISISILLHKDSNITKYREELLPQVRAAETIEEVKKVTWNPDDDGGEEDWIYEHEEPM